MPSDFQTSSHFLHFPRFPLAIKWKSPNYRSANHLRRSSLRTSHKKSEKGSAPLPADHGQLATSRLLAGTQCCGRSPTEPLNRDRRSPRDVLAALPSMPLSRPKVSLPTRFPRFPHFPKESARGISQPQSRQYVTPPSSEKLPSKNQKREAIPSPPPRNFGPWTLDPNLVPRPYCPPAFAPNPGGAPTSGLMFSRSQMFRKRTGLP